MSSEMRDKQEIEDRIAGIILDAMNKGRFRRSTRAAEAIVGELGLTFRRGTAYNHDHPDGENLKRIVGKWERE